MPSTGNWIAELACISVTGHHAAMRRERSTGRGNVDESHLHRVVPGKPDARGYLLYYTMGMEFKNRQNYLR